MKVILGSYNLYTKTVDATAKTLVIGGVTGFDLTENSLDAIWDTTTSAFIPCKGVVTLVMTYVLGLPVYTYTFSSLPAGTAASDTFVITLDIPEYQANYAISQFLASKP